MRNGVCFIILQCTVVAYIVNTMDPDQTTLFGAVELGFIVFASMIKSDLEYIWIYAADIKSRHHFFDKQNWLHKGDKFAT